MIHKRDSINNLSEDVNVRECVCDPVMIVSRYFGTLFIVLFCFNLKKKREINLVALDETHIRYHFGWIFVGQIRLRLLGVALNIYDLHFHEQKQKKNESQTNKLSV